MAHEHVISSHRPGRKPCKVMRVVTYARLRDVSRVRVVRRSLSFQFFALPLRDLPVTAYNALASPRTTLVDILGHSCGQDPFPPGGSSLAAENGIESVQRSLLSCEHHGRMRYRRRTCHRRKENKEETDRWCLVYGNSLRARTRARTRARSSHQCSENGNKNGSFALCPSRSCAAQIAPRCDIRNRDMRMHWMYFHKSQRGVRVENDIGPGRRNLGTQFWPRAPEDSMSAQPMIPSRTHLQ